MCFLVKKEKDNLAALLVLIADHYKIKTNQNQLTAGLPLVNGRLTPDLFILIEKLDLCDSSYWQI